MTDKSVVSSDTQGIQLLPQKKKKHKKWMMAAIGAVVLLASGFVIFTGMQENSSSVKNVLMPDPVSVDSQDYFVFGSDIPRSEIEAIKILDSTKDAHVDAIDVSAAQDGSVLLWRWNDQNLDTLFIAADGGVWAPENCRGLFMGYESLKYVDFSAAFHTENVVDMSFMFASCSSVESLDLSSFHTSRVTTMEGMFRDCVSLTKLDVKSFDTSSVINMEAMFLGCTELVYVDLTSFDTSQVSACDDFMDPDSTIHGFPWRMYLFEHIPQSGRMTHSGGYRSNWDYKVFDTDIPRSEIQQILFLNSFALVPGDALFLQDISEGQDGSVKLYRGNTDGFDTLFIAADGMVYAPKGCDYLFCGYTNLVRIDFNGCFSTQGVTGMRGMFWGCEKLTQLDVSGFDTSQVKDMCAMFQGCHMITSLDVSGFITSKVTDFSYMFSECRALGEIDVIGFDTSNAQSMACMFDHCNSLRSLDIRSFDTSNVTNMVAMFGWCHNLKTLELGTFDTSNVTQYEDFYPADKLPNGIAWRTLFED